MFILTQLPLASAGLQVFSASAVTRFAQTDSRRDLKKSLVLQRGRNRPDNQTVMPSNLPGLE
jgi:hypothetical protein